MLLPHQFDGAKSFVQGRKVHDFGAGATLPSVQPLLDMGAREIICIEKEHLVDGIEIPPKVTVRHERFEAWLRIPLVAEPIDVMWISKPINNVGYALELTEIMKRAQTVVYLGSNTGGTACACPAFFENTMRRELLAYIPNETTTLMVLGKPLLCDRSPTGEELAGISTEMLSFLTSEERALHLANARQPSTLTHD